jgi:5-methylcytosine-specific restriction endonuclease McrA
MVLVLTGKAQVIVEGKGFMNSARQSFPIPSVIRLNYFVKVPYKARMPLNRRAILTRDNHTCQYCGKSADTLDHVIPRSKGGLHTWENLVACCRKCNYKKADKSLKEIGWELARKPVCPSGSFWMVIGIKVDPLWEPYLGL